MKLKMENNHFIWEQTIFFVYFITNKSYIFPNIILES